MMKSDFLNLPSSDSGDARRHVPFRSIINKHFSILFVIVFVFSIMFSYVHPVVALADPVFQPVYDTQIYQLPNYVDNLTPVQQDIFYFILGSEVVEYAGFTDYYIDNPYTDPQDIGDWFKKIGIDLYNDVIETYSVIASPVFVSYQWVKDLYANIAGAANFASNYDDVSFDSWFNNVQTNGLSLNLYPAMFGALNQFFAVNDSIYDWQFSDDPLKSVWITFTGDNYGSGALTNYVDYYNQLTYHTKFNLIPINHKYNTVVSIDLTPVLSYNNLFININNNTYYLCDNDGNVLNYYIYGEWYYVYFGDNTLSGEAFAYKNSFNRSFYHSPYSFTDLGTVVNNLRNSNLSLFRFYNSSGYTENVFPIDFLNKVYIGNSWSDKQELSTVNDLNFTDNTNQNTLLPVIDILIDLKGFISDLLDTNALKPPVLDNITDTNGSPVPATQLQPVSVAVELPDSGITINSGLFTPLTKDGGYINYLWYMTKPFVQYTSDLVQTLVFPDDTGEGFDVTGPGVIIFGVISLGLIGGLVVKCLL